MPRCCQLARVCRHDSVQSCVLEVCGGFPAHILWNGHRLTVNWLLLFAALLLVLVSEPFFCCSSAALDAIAEAGGFRVP